VLKSKVVRFNSRFIVVNLNFTQLKVVVYNLKLVDGVADTISRNDLLIKSLIKNGLQLSKLNFLIQC
jgi:transcription termination factor NusB